jgi:hypothetical protein
MFPVAEAIRHRSSIILNHEIQQSPKTVLMSPNGSTRRALNTRTSNSVHRAGH